LFIWSQDIVVVRGSSRNAAVRWLIGELGAMRIERQVSGPVRTLDQWTLEELDAREAERAAHKHEDQKWSEDQTHAFMNFLRLRGVGM
jgi:ribosomal protein S28E/S33